MITPEFPLPCSTSFVFYKIFFTFYSITLLSFILSQMSVSCLLITLQLEYKFHTDRGLFSLSSKSQEPRTVHSTSRHAIMKPRDVFFSISLYSSISFSSCILKLCYLVYAHLGWLCLLGEWTPFFIMYCPSLSLVIFLIWSLCLILKRLFQLSFIGICIAYIFYPFTFNLLISLYLKWISCW